MAEGLDQAAQAFSNEIAPESRPRDQSGRFVQTAGKPEPIFGERETEGEEDAGPDPVLLEQERRVADGRDEDEQAEQGAGGKAAEDGKQQPAEDEQKEPDKESDDESTGQLYEVALPDGNKAKVTIDDMAKGYVDGQTFNNRMGQLAEAAKNVEGFASQIAQHRAALIERLQQHETEYQALLPQEPNWDRFFKEDPERARAFQKEYTDAKGRVSAMQAERQRLEQEQMIHAQQAREQYAAQGFNIWTQRAGIKDQASLNNELTAMQRTAAEYGFTTQEISEVYDPRMLAILHDASKYKRLQASNPRPVQPEKGRTLAPGAARPINGQARRGIDDALKQQAARGGGIDATAAVFQKMFK